VGASNETYGPGQLIKFVETSENWLLAWMQKHIPDICEVTLKKRKVRRRGDAPRNCGRETAEWVKKRRGWASAMSGR
jgi:hypothetical protein